MNNPVPNKFTRIVVAFLTNRDDDFCIADEIRRHTPGVFADPMRLKRSTILLLTTDKEVRETAKLWRQLLLTVLDDPCGVDWNYVSTALAADHAAN